MCSIFGYYKLNKLQSVDQKFVQNAIRLLHHRGPDARSFKEYSQVAGLGNNRLSIIDTREISNQPMESTLSSIVYNGEIYNYSELQKSYLSKVELKTTSDTEVLQRGLEKYGVDFLHKTNGMFAFAWFNKSDKSLLLARDRFGVKPLHYTIINGILYYSSEITPLLLLRKRLKRNKSVYSSFFSDTATDFDNQTFIQGIYQVEKGSSIECRNGKIYKKKWYYGNDYQFDNKIFKNKTETINNFEKLLISAIKIRLRSDVPVCMTLSGGLDSTLIYTLMKEKIGVAVTLFTFVNENSDINEIKAVRQLTAKYGDVVHQINSKSINMLSLIKTSLKSLEFPIWDISAIAYSETYKTIHKKGFKVVIEGHGSDEMLGGYPYLLLSAVKQLITELRLIKAFQLFNIYIQSYQANINKEINIIAEYLSLIRSIILTHRPKANFQNELDKAFKYQILPIVLRAFDRLTMAHSVESRSPYLDYRVVEFIKKLPMEYKVSTIGSKAILRELLKKYHKDFIYKNYKKIGFGLDFTHILEDKYIRKFFISMINIFKNNDYSSQKEKALTDLNSSLYSDQDIDNIWKVASVSYIESLHNIQD